MTRHAKIVATIGPAVEEPEMIRQLIVAGMDVARLNFSHGTREQHGARIASIREESSRVGKPIAILQDLQGPKIRTGSLSQGEVALREGAEFIITTEPVEGNERGVSTTYEELPRDVEPGDPILLADGLMELRVERLDRNSVVTRVVHGGMLGEHKGINLPGVNVSAPSLTPKDRDDLEFGMAQNVDYVALSFVRRAADVFRVKEVLERAKVSIPIIAKLEKPEAIGRLSEIIEASDGVMVARGDLAVESSVERVPLLQKEIIREANRRGKVVITATQMLESMMTNPRPTRAEASDVANAILDGTDAVMLSGETASGRFPVECVRIMDQIVRAAEERYRHFGTPVSSAAAIGTPEVISHAVSSLDGSEITALATHTRLGRSALMLSKARSRVPLFAFTSNPETLSRMPLYWGVVPLLIDEINGTDELLACIEKRLVARRAVLPGEVIAVVMGSPPGTPTNMLKLHHVSEPAATERSYDE